MTYFCVPAGLRDRAPLQPRGIARAAAPAQAALDHFLRSLRAGVISVKTVHQRLYTVARDVVFDALGSMMPEFSSTIFFCRWKNGMSVGQTRRATGAASRLSSDLRRVRRR